jgi:hypothetical protein
VTGGCVAAVVAASTNTTHPTLRALDLLTLGFLNPILR